MRIETDTQQVFDDTNPDCTMLVVRSCGALYAFIQCLDANPRNNKPFIKRYWGPFSWDSQEASIKNILENGGEWPKLPE
tara:strand:- start:9763 stop:9999 length:237 start_codon:yes stop_codon:yes gene_type:complete